MERQAPAWVVPAMRAGHAARGFVYATVAAISLAAAFWGGAAVGPEGALTKFRGGPAGTLVLVLVAIGLLLYAIWRLVAAWMDLEMVGRGPRGLLARAAMLLNAIIYVGFAGFAGELALGLGASAGSGRIVRVTGEILSIPHGHWIVMGLGAAIVGAGIFNGSIGVRASYKTEIASTPLTRRLGPVCRFGIVAQAVVIGIAGCFAIWAGWTYDPSQAGGFGEVFQSTAAARDGRVLVGLLGAGMLAFAVYCLVEARYRILPAREDGLVPSLEDKAADLVA